jgi:Fe2+ or Zn2+ uptake regulation protein
MSGTFSLRSVAVKSPPAERFAQFLQSRGKRMSQQHRLIVEQVFSHHDHLYCQGCNRLIEFHTPDLERICAAVAREADFQVIGHRMFVTGICAACRRGPRD